jgi:hypothetical protein
MEITVPSQISLTLPLGIFQCRRIQSRRSLPMSLPVCTLPLLPPCACSEFKARSNQPLLRRHLRFIFLGTLDEHIPFPLHILWPLALTRRPVYLAATTPSKRSHPRLRSTTSKKPRQEANKQSTPCRPRRKWGW